MTDMTITWDGDRAPFAKAFVAAQKATEAVKKASSNPAFRSKYADLSGVVEAVVPALNAAGIGVLQFPAYDGDMMHLTTTFLHESGSSVTGTLALRPSKQDPQGVGSAVTYGRRYSLLAMTGAAPEDDDGNAASGPQEAVQRRDPPPTAKPSQAYAVALNTLESYQRDPDAFREFWEKNKDGFKANFDQAEYADLVAAMKRIAGSMPKADAPTHTRNGKAIPETTPPMRPASELIGADEIPW